MPDYPIAASWLELPAGTGFGLAALPFGSFSVHDGRRRTGVAIGDRVLDLAGLTGDPVHATGTLNAFLERGPAAWATVRAELTALLSDESGAEQVVPHLVDTSEVELHLPIEVADYVDFYSSRHHAENVGRIFRPDSQPLTPNWTHLPIGYHGRAGTVAVSGTPVMRPHGQRRPSHESDLPGFGPTQRLDIEAEVAFVVGAGSPLGTQVPVGDLARHVFGVCLLNDWSARDIQAWEYVPLGPFLGKSFLTSVSPWVMPLAALEAARVPAPERATPLQDYLQDAAHPWGLDLELQVELNGSTISRPPFRQLYWTPAQQLAHLTVNGASLRTGDLFASGTVSGPERDQRGSLLELSWGGTEPFELGDGTSRTFLLDGDEVRISATAPGLDGSRISLGEVTGTVAPARPA
jgi:fumarylacetoacetase